MPDRITTLDDTLGRVMVAFALCCEDAVNQYLAEAIGARDIKQIEERVPAIREWLTIKGAKEHRDEILHLGDKLEQAKEQPSSQLEPTTELAATLDDIGPSDGAAALVGGKLID